MATQVFRGDIRIEDGDLVIAGESKRPRPDVRRAWIAQDTLAVFPVTLTDLKIFDSGLPLTVTANTDDLAYVVGTHGTDCPVISAGDLKAAGATSRKARFQLRVPAEYDPGETLTIQAAAGMLTTIADVSCTIDFAAFKVGRDSLVSGSDLVTTSATTINSLVFSNKSFVVTASGLLPGDVLDVLMTIACNDAATATAVKPTVAAIDLLCDIRG